MNGDDYIYINAKLADGLTLAEACMCRTIEHKLAPEYREGGSQHGYTVKQYLESRAK